MHKILITTSQFSGHDNPVIAELKRHAFDVVLNPYQRKLTEDEILNLLKPDVIGLIAGVEPLTAAVLKAAKGLKIISRCGVGIDNVDHVAAEHLGIKLFNTPEAPTIAVAELTVALMLNALRKIPQSDQSIRQGRFQKFMGQSLHGKTVGMVGFGRIGQCVAQRVTAFGAHVIAYDTTIPNSSLSETLTKADIVSLHVPYTKDTHHLMNQKTFALMKSSAIVINAARGGLIDEAALYQALMTKQIAGAAIDCFEQEPYQGRLVELENVILTAHIGSYAEEARQAMEREAAQNMLTGLKQLGVI